jgi:hypothetical protein
VADRSGIIQRLEDKVAAALRDHNLTAAAGGTPVAQSAMAEYNRLVQDASFPTGIKYLALHSVAVKQGFYVDKRDQQEMLGTVAQEMGNLSPTEVLAGIQRLKSNYPVIYQCDAVALDRKESSIVELMTRLPIEQQDRAVAEAKNVQLEARPITSGASEAIEPVKSAVVNTVSYQVTTEVLQETPPVYNSVQNPVSSFHSTQSPTQINNSNQISSKNALIIGGGIVAGAMIFSMAFLSSRNSQQPQVNSPIEKDNVVISSSPIPKTEVSNADKKLPQAIVSTKQLYAVDNVASNDVLWIHSGPGVKTANIGSIPYDGQSIEALGEGVIVKTSLWLPVKYQSFNGWVNSKFLRRQ